MPRMYSATVRGQIVSRLRSGGMMCRPTSPDDQSAIARQANSSPLSHRSTAGKVSGSVARRLSSPTRCSPVILRSTIPPKHSPVCSSTIATILIGHPSVVTSNWKSTAHARLGASEITVGGAVELPWPLCRRRCRTRSPSSRQRHCIFS